MYNSSKNIVLIGMPGCGKTTIGKPLAKKLGMKFINMDCLIEEQAGCTINELFLQGEEHFRELETEAVLALEKKEACVIATGGGIIKRVSNMESLKKNGIIVYIDRPIEDIAGDIDISTRPLLADGVGQLIKLYAERDSLYKKYSDFIVKNEGEVAELVENIINIFIKISAGRSSYKNYDYKLGPNINMLSVREKAIYGHKSYEEICTFINSKSEKLGIEDKRD